jgi:hypothetical protein
MKIRPNLLAVVVISVFAASATAGAQRQRVFGTIVERAPVTLSPEPNRMPLATLEPGTQVQVLGTERNGWYRISFQAGYLFGDRIGYVRVEHLKLSTPSNGTNGRGASTAPSIDLASRPGGRLPDSTLTDDDIATAVFEGRQRIGTHGLQLRDAAIRSRFRLQIHTPIAWIRQLASDAARDDRKFDVSDVTSEMREPILRVTAYSAFSESEAKAGSAGVSWVRHVFLRNESRSIVVQPLSKLPFAEHVVNATGSKAISQGLRLTFPIDAMRELRGPSGDAEFFITVVGGRGEQKHLRITRKQFADLPI